MLPKERVSWRPYTFENEMIKTSKLFPKTLLMGACVLVALFIKLSSRFGIGERQIWIRIYTRLPATTQSSCWLAEPKMQAN
jgi:hypothetical protein